MNEILSSASQSWACRLSSNFRWEFAARIAAEHSLNALTFGEKSVFDDFGYFLPLGPQNEHQCDRLSYQMDPNGAKNKLRWLEISE